jgi:thiamine biosynthesis lipoprotein
VKPDGSPWTIGVRNPFADLSQYMCTITLDDECVSTSGAYERGFTSGGTYYHHILDPRTGMPADNELASVSVVDADGMKTDIYSTALFVMGLEEGLAFANRENLDTLFITKDRGIYLTDGFTHNFELKDEAFHVEAL